MADFKDPLTRDAVFFFQREYLLVLNKKRAYKVSTRSNSIEVAKLANMIQPGGSCFIDAQFFYFLTRGDEEGHTKLAITSTDMLEAAFSDNTKEVHFAIGGDED